LANWTSDNCCACNSGIISVPEKLLFRPSNKTVWYFSDLGVYAQEAVLTAIRISFALLMSGIYYRNSTCLFAYIRLM
jgi:hypothetical protein